MCSSDLSDGSWSVTPAQALAEGTQAVTVTATDGAGNTSAPGTVSLTIDTRAPAAPSADVAAASDTGASSADNITSDTTPTIQGTGTPGDRITVTMPGGEVLTATVAGDGTWSVTPTQALSDGTQSVSITATDPAGNTSAATALPITIDTTANVPTVSSVVGNTLTPVLRGGAQLARERHRAIVVGAHERHAALEAEQQVVVEAGGQLAIEQRLHIAPLRLHLRSE